MVGGGSGRSGLSIQPSMPPPINAGIEMPYGIDSRAGTVETIP